MISPLGFRTNNARTTPCRPVTATTWPSSRPPLSYAFLPKDIVGSESAYQDDDNGNET